MHGLGGGLLVVVIGLAAVTVMASIRRRALGLGQLGRLLLPSWRLFDQDGTQPRLFVRRGDEPGALGPWREVEALKSAVPFDPRRSHEWGVRSLFAQLAAAVDETDPDASEELADAVPYRLVKAIASRSAGEGAFQFKLRADEDIVISPIYAPEAPDR